MTDEDSRLLPFLEWVLQPIPSVDDSDSEEQVLALLFLNGPHAKIPKVDNYLEVVAQYSDEEVFLSITWFDCNLYVHHFFLQFRRNFRIKPAVAEKLIDDFNMSEFTPAHISTGGLVRITGREHILSFLWFPF